MNPYTRRGRAQIARGGVVEKEIQLVRLRRSPGGQLQIDLMPEANIVDVVMALQAAAAMLMVTYGFQPAKTRDQVRAEQAGVLVPRLVPLDPGGGGRAA